MRFPHALATLVLVAACSGEPSEVPDPGESSNAWVGVRAAMVERIRELGVSDAAVLSALASVPRHRFVPNRLRSRSYELMPLPIGDGQTISDPYIVGLMTDLLDLEGGERVLEIGTGSGYQAAVLARLVPKVWTIEIRPRLAETARQRLADLGFANVEVRCGDGYQGWPDLAPFDAIIVTAAPPTVPEALVEQLALNGRLVVPVGRQDANQTLLLLTKDEDGKVRERRDIKVRFVPMIRDD